MSNADATVDLRALTADLAAASGQPYKQIAERLVSEGAQQVEKFAYAYSPVRTGFNRSVILAQVNGMSAEIVAHAPYSRALEYGTGTRGEFPGRPIVIHAKPGGVLAFKGRDGKMVFVKKVVSPGMAPRPFMRPAVERVAWPLATSLANNAVVMITHGPNHPESLLNAPASSPYNQTAQAKGQAEALALVQTGLHSKRTIQKSLIQ
jgi:hypothetical protein